MTNQKRKTLYQISWNNSGREKELDWFPWLKVMRWSERGRQNKSCIFIWKWIWDKKNWLNAWKQMITYNIWKDLTRNMEQIWLIVLIDEKIVLCIWRKTSPMSRSIYTHMWICVYASVCVCSFLRFRLFWQNIS